MRRFAAALGIALLAVALAAVLGACRGAPPEPRMTVFAAASLRDAMIAAGSAFAATGEPPPRFNFAGSNVLARQIEAAPRADLFISANDQWMDHLEVRALLLPGSRRPLLSNRLVLVTHRDSDFVVEHPADLLGLPFRHLAVGDPRAVPAGIYARRYLALPTGDAAADATASDLWQALEERRVPMPDVRAALQMVAANREAIGVVYRTDALAAARCRVLYEFPAGSGPAIVYPAAVLREGPRRDLGERFLAFLESPPGRAILDAHGFLPPAESDG